MSGDDLYRGASGQAVIPRGTLVMYESKPSEGYVLNSDFLSFQKIQEQPVENAVTYQTPQVPEQVVRGDLTFSKKTGDSADRMAGIPFKLTSLTTGETHVIVTDANGYSTPRPRGTPTRRTPTATTGRLANPNPSTVFCSIPPQASGSASPVRAP